MNDEWKTPDYVFNYLNNIFCFDFDAAAKKENSRCEKFTNNSLIDEWDGERIWLNPPYSRGNLPRFLEKAYKTSLKGKVVVCLVPLDMTGWVRDWIIKKAQVWIPDERIAFINPENGLPGCSPSKGSMIVIYGSGSLRVDYIHIPKGSD